ncbi:MAG: hypothetical protein HY512_00305 [Candidatus Aenigmarchaeota archaeon]|nr:hypothetical protein [Candidatus Aenigmarchaeota archaeon]
MYKKVVLVLLLISVIFISGCAQSEDIGTTQKEIKAKKQLTIESYCKSTGKPPPCEANDTVITPTPSEIPAPSTSFPPILPSSISTPITSLPPTLPTSSPTSDCVVTYTPPKEQWIYGPCTNSQKTRLTEVTYTYKGKNCKPSEITPKISEPCTPDPTTSATPTTTTSTTSPPTSLPSSSASPITSASSSPSPTSTVKQFGCCVVCKVDQQGYAFFPSGSYTMTEIKCNSYNQGDDAFAGHYLWGDNTDICPIKGPPVQEYEIGSEINNIDVYKFCAAFGRVPPQ